MSPEFIAAEHFARTCVCPVCDEEYKDNGDNSPIVGISMGDCKELLCRACENDLMIEEE